MTQFGQALGTVTFEGRLNSVMEQTPALAKAIAQGMGLQLVNFTVAAEGKITSDVLVKALTKLLMMLIHNSQEQTQPLHSHSPN